jgi:hypothetical protein
VAERLGFRLVGHRLELFGVRLQPPKNGGNDRGGGSR